MSHLPETEQPTEATFEEAARWISECDCLLIAGGAGLSAAAGLDYTSHELFQKHFPVMHSYGFRNFYNFIGYVGPFCPDGRTPWDADLRWGYLSKQIKLVRYNWPAPHAVYAQLLSIANRCGDYFVISTNADGMFVRSGFPAERIFNPQGDYSHLQCMRKCRPDAYWSAEPVLDAIAETVDARTMRCASRAVPTCPHCHGPAFLNVRGGDWFIEDVFRQKKTYTSWLKNNVHKNMVIIEVGVGFNTPGVLRYPMEALVGEFPNVKIIRINQEYPFFEFEVPLFSISNRDNSDAKGISVPLDAAAAIETIFNKLELDH
jgi:NAD-dependent SIR2 family protein deacetylase